MTDIFKTVTGGDFIIAGPCIIEGEAMIMKLAENIAEMCERTGFGYIFKASFDKANRTSISSYRGPGVEEGIRILQKVKDELGLAVTTDIHEAYQADMVKDVADIIQIPAFLCRQTDLLAAAAKTGRTVNIKKAQFLSGADMVHPVQKVRDSGGTEIMLTERGTLHGYGDLVVDFRNIREMKDTGCPVVMDATHSVQKPGGLGGKSGGNREYAPFMAYAASVFGCDGYFFEVHEDPECAKSDGPNMIPLADFERVLTNLKAVQDTARSLK